MSGSRTLHIYFDHILYGSSGVRAIILTNFKTNGANESTIYKNYVVKKSMAPDIFESIEIT